MTAIAVAAGILKRLAVSPEAAAQHDELRAKALAITGPLLTARAQAQLDSEESRGQALMSQLATVSGVAGVALTVGATVMITLLPRRLPLEHVHVLGVSVGTILAVAFGGAGFGLLIFVTFGLQALSSGEYRIGSAPQLITAYLPQLDGPPQQVLTGQLLEINRQVRLAIAANSRRQALLARVVRLLVAGFLSIVGLAAIMLIGSPRPTEVRVITTQAKTHIEISNR
jgi:hypothetical protein